MQSSVEQTNPAAPGTARRFDFRVAIAAVLLVPAAVCTLWTIQGLQARRNMRMELAEISHVRYGLLNADRWRDILVPILNARIDALDLKGSAASLRPMVEKALYRLLDDVKDKMSAPDPQSTGLGGLLAGQGNALMATMVVGKLKPHVPEYTTVVLAELARPENKEAVKNYIAGVLAEGAKGTFGSVDMRWYSSILKRYGCADTSACQQELGKRIGEADATVARYYFTVLLAAALAFVLVMVRRPVLGRTSVALLMAFCLVLLAGGILTPMLEVEAKISKLSMTLLGQKVAFQDQLLYFQSKSVLEVFQALINKGRADMWIVGVLVLTFSVIFPTLKILTLGVCMHRPALLRENRLVRFLALESSKWSMADVMALAIFMAYVAFNGLIANTMSGLAETGADIVIPTDSSKILPGYYLFIGFCLASLFLSKKLEKGIRTAPLEALH